jgi:hypothetical protein
MDRRRIEAFRKLGIPADSDQDAIAHAYRRLARMIHPDVSAAPGAAARFAELSAAYGLASQAPDTPDVSAPTAWCEPRDGGSPRRGSARDIGWARDGAQGSGTVPDWSMWMARTPSRPRRQGAPIVAGPVFITPARRMGEGEVRGG